MIESSSSNISKFGIKQIYRRLIIKAEGEERDTSSLRRRLGELESRKSKKQKLDYAKSLLGNVVQDLEFRSNPKDNSVISAELYQNIKRFLCE